MKRRLEHHPVSTWRGGYHEKYAAIYTRWSRHGYTTTTDLLSASREVAAVMCKAHAQLSANFRGARAPCARWFRRLCIYYLCHLLSRLYHFPLFVYKKS